MPEAIRHERVGCAEVMEIGGSDDLCVSLSAQKTAEEKEGHTWKGKDLCRD